jgi:hypothetical protein
VAELRVAVGACWITPWDFGLIDASTNSPNWDKATCDDHYAGKGKWLYEPANNDPALCPGADWSRYECSLCGKFVKPFSNDQGELICPTCEATGLVILDDEQLDRIEQVREHARALNLSSQLERQLNYLAGYDGRAPAVRGRVHDRRRDRGVFGGNRLGARPDHVDWQQLPWQSHRDLQLRGEAPFLETMGGPVRDQYRTEFEESIYGNARLPFNIQPIGV